MIFEYQSTTSSGRVPEVPYLSKWRPASLSEPLQLRVSELIEVRTSLCVVQGTESRRDSAVRCIFLFSCYLIPNHLPSRLGTYLYAITNHQFAPYARVTFVKVYIQGT